MLHSYIVIRTDYTKHLHSPCRNYKPLLFEISWLDYLQTNLYKKKKDKQGINLRVWGWQQNPFRLEAIWNHSPLHSSGYRLIVLYRVILEILKHHRSKGASSTSGQRIVQAVMKPSGLSRNKWRQTVRLSFKLPIVHIQTNIKTC